MSYVKPAQVISPKAHWKLIVVLVDGGAGDIAYALGEWDGTPRIGFRWNGTDDNAIGNPQSRGLPTWTMLDQDLHLAIIQKLPEGKQTLACSLLGIETPPVIEIKIAYHPSGRHTLMKRVSGQRMYEDALGDGLFVNMNKVEFLEATYLEIKTHLDHGTRVVLHDFPRQPD